MFPVHSLNSVQQARPRAIRIHRTTALVALAYACAVPHAMAQANPPTVFSTPGVHTYTVPAGSGSLSVEVQGASGGAGGWDDAIGGAGAGGTIVKATITVAGGETLSILVGEGGKGSVMDTTPISASGLAGAGGAGGKFGTLGGSPTGAGGGGISAITFTNGAALVAAGGGGGGSNSRIAGPSGSWSIPGTAATNGALVQEQAALCGTPANGGNGVDAEAANGGAPVDGAGGSGGGGGFSGHAGAGGNAGRDGRGGVNGEPGGSGDSCTWNSGEIMISLGASAVGPATAPKSKGPQDAGVNGSVSISAIPAPPNTVPAATPALSGSATVGQALAGSYTYTDTEGDPEDATASGSKFVLVRSTTPGLTASSQGTLVQSGATRGAATPFSYTLAAEDENRYLSYCVTPIAGKGANPGVEACSATVGPVAAANPLVPPPTANATPVPVMDNVGLLLVSATLGGLGALLARRRKSQASN